MAVQIWSGDSSHNPVSEENLINPKIQHPTPKITCLALLCEYVRYLPLNGSSLADHTGSQKFIQKLPT